MENKKMSLWKQSKPYLAGLQFALLIAFIATIVSNIITVYGPTRIKEMTNIIASGLETSVDVAAVAAIGSFLAKIFWIAFTLVVTLIRVTNRHVIWSDEDMILLINFFFLIFNINKLWFCQLINLINHVSSLSQSCF